MITKSKKLVVKIDDRHVASVYISNYITGHGLISDAIQILHFQGITDKAKLVGVSSHPHDKDDPDDIILYYKTKKNQN